MDKRTIVEWEKEFETKVMDGDGFPQDTNRFITLFTEEEFLNNCRTSTIIFSYKMREAMENFDSTLDK